MLKNIIDPVPPTCKSSVLIPCTRTPVRDSLCRQLYSMFQIQIQIQSNLSVNYLLKNLFLN